MENSTNHYYNRKLQPKANALRKNMTKAEACLWKYVLRAKQMKNCQFRRQRPVLNYVADFMCKELSLIIEVDGWTHTQEETYRRDVKRQSELEALGFTIIRFTDEQVLKDINNVVLTIERWIEENFPPPYPRQRGIMNVARLTQKAKSYIRERTCSACAADVLLWRRIQEEEINSQKKAA